MANLKSRSGRRQGFAAVLASLIFWPALLAAAEHRGSVRAADQFIPGATVTASQGGGAKVVAFTDENGRYTLNLAPGLWDIQVDMFGFTSAQGQIAVTGEPTFKDWTLEMPRVDERDKAAAPTPSKSVPDKSKGTAPPSPVQSAAAPPKPDAPAPNGSSAPSRNGPGYRRGGQQGRSGQGQGLRPGFQNAAVTATAEGRQALAEAANQIPGDSSGFNPGGEGGEEAMLVSGSTSGGLAAASDEEDRRQRYMRDRGAPPGMGGLPGEAPGPGGMGLPPGMGGALGGDSLGLGGLGASAINGGFGDGGPGFGGPGGGPPGRGGPGGGPPGGDRGGGFGGRGPGGRDQGGDRRNRRGPYDGQYSSFGNHRRTQPAYTGSVFMNLNNSALNAAPYSLNGQAATQAFLRASRFGVSFGGPLVIPKLVNWQRASFYFTYSGTRSRNPYSEVSSVPTLAERAGDFSGAHQRRAHDLRSTQSPTVRRQYHSRFAIRSAPRSGC